MSVTPQQAWSSSLSQVSRELPNEQFNTWVRSAIFSSFDDCTHTFRISTANSFARDWLESRLTESLTQKLSAILQTAVRVVFAVQYETNCDEPFEPEVEAQPSTSGPTIELRHSTHDRYSFNNFVVGNNSRLAHAASLSVAENPAHSYNPLFLYGGVGLGKTHLLWAIGNACTARGLSVLYVSSEEFTNDLIQSIREKATQSFREKYRRMDVLLVDDIQFIAGKESTQEEFFHTFNTLYNQDKQVVLTSDRSPRAMGTLEERLRSRFEWGLIADLQPPDYETRIAILQAKAQQLCAEVPSEVIELIARNVNSNIRELEGALNRLIAYATFTNQSISPAVASAALVDKLSRPQLIRPEDILQAVSREFGITAESLIGTNRSKEYALPRHAAMYLLREEAKLSLPIIGELLGGRDHTTIMYGIDRIKILMDTDLNLKQKVQNIQALLNAALY